MEDWEQREDEMHDHLHDERLNHSHSIVEEEKPMFVRVTALLMATIFSSILLGVSIALVVWTYNQTCRLISCT